MRNHRNVFIFCIAAIIFVWMAFYLSAKQSNLYAQKTDSAKIILSYDKPIDSNDSSIVLYPKGDTWTWAKADSSPVYFDVTIEKRKMIIDLLKTIDIYITENDSVYKILFGKQYSKILCPVNSDLIILEYK